MSRCEQFLGSGFEMIMQLFAFIPGSARASRADCGASPQSTLLKCQQSLISAEKFAMAGALSPARETRALPSISALRAVSLVTIVCASILVGCKSMTNSVPPVISQMSAVKTAQPIDPATLREGRTLFVHRCIECHTVPSVWHYRKEDWPEIVNRMSQRASLSPAERDAIISYILAVRTQH